MSEDLIGQLVRYFANEENLKHDIQAQLHSVWKMQSAKTVYNVWNKESKAQMIAAVKECGYNIGRIQHKFFPDRTYTQLKNQYFYLKKTGKLAQ